MSSVLDDSTALICFYVTKKSWRGKGIGRKVYDLSCQPLGQRQIGLNADWSHQKMYASGAFKVSTFTMITYNCAIKDVVVFHDELAKTNLKVLPLQDVDFEKILAYDKKIHPMERKEILRWFIDFAHVGLVAMEDDAVVGWGSVYKARRGFKFMPLYADSFECAKVIGNELLKQIASNTEVEVEVAFPEGNLNAKKLFHEFNITSGREVFHKRMFTEKDIPIPDHFVYSVLNYHNVLV